METIGELTINSIGSTYDDNGSKVQKNAVSSCIEL